MKGFQLIYIFLVVISLQSCNRFRGIRGQGPTVEQIRTQLPVFTGVDVGISANVYLMEGDEYEIKIHAQENILPHIRTRHSGTLRIEFDRNISSHEPITIYVTAPMLDHFSMSSSGTAYTVTPIESDHFSVDLVGSGNIYFDLMVNEHIETTISGSGRVILEGYCDAISSKITGSGNIEALQLETVKAEATITGSGNISVNVFEQLDAKITGSGSVFYIGEPILEVTVSGSGRVNKIG